MSFDKWGKKELVHLTDKIGSGATPRGGSKVYLKTGIPLIRSQNVYNSVFSEDGLVYIDDKKAKKLDNVTLCENDILLNITGDSVARCTIVPQQYIGGRVNQHVAIIRTDKNYLNPQFLKYFLISPSMQSRMLSLARMGATRAALTKGMIESFEIPTPDLIEQKAIANILSTLDEKIEVNNQINQTLENMAQELFKRWFVDFEFPNEDGAPYQSSGGEMIESELGLIPIGWEVNEFNNLAENVSGYSYKGKDLEDSKDALITIKNFNRNGGFKVEGFKDIKISERVKEKHYADLLDIIVAHTDLTQNADIIGNPIMIMNKSDNNNLIFSMDTVKVIPKLNESRYFVFQLLKHSDFKNFALAHTSGTTVLHLSKKAIPKYKFSSPPEDLIKKYNNTVEPFFRKNMLVHKENEKLKSIRDTLLPKLISGEIRVPLEDLEESLTEVKGG